MQKVCFIVGEDSFEKMMMQMILGTTGAALDTEMHFFFTFFGLNLLKKSFKPKVAGMPRPMKRMAAGMFKAKMKKYGIEENWKIGFVNLDPDVHQDLYFSETVAVNRGFLCRVFDNEMKAREWLHG